MFLPVRFHAKRITLGVFYSGAYTTSMYTKVLYRPSFFSLSRLFNYAHLISFLIQLNHAKWNDEQSSSTTTNTSTPPLLVKPSYHHYSAPAPHSVIYVILSPYHIELDCCSCTQGKIFVSQVYKLRHRAVVKMVICITAPAAIMLNL